MRGCVAYDTYRGSLPFQAGLCNENQSIGGVARTNGSTAEVAEGTAFRLEESEACRLDRPFGTGSAVLKRFEKQQVQVLGHQVDVGLE